MRKHAFDFESRHLVDPVSQMVERIGRPCSVDHITILIPVQVSEVAKIQILMQQQSRKSATQEESLLIE